MPSRLVLSSRSAMADNIPAEQTQSPLLLSWAIFGLGRDLLRILGVPVVAYVIDPRQSQGAQERNAARRRGQARDLVMNTPVRASCATRAMDAGRSIPMTCLAASGGAGRRAPANVADMTERNRSVPHGLTTSAAPGCSVNTGGPAFACPCHAATFTITGARAAAGNPAQRAWTPSPGKSIRRSRAQSHQSDLQEYKANDAKKIRSAAAMKKRPTISAPSCSAGKPWVR